MSTTFGELQVTILGDRKKPAMLAYHDIGLNRITFLLTVTLLLSSPELSFALCFALLQPLFVVCLQVVNSPSLSFFEIARVLAAW